MVKRQRRLNPLVGIPSAISYEEISPDIPRHTERVLSLREYKVYVSDFSRHNGGKNSGMDQMNSSRSRVFTPLLLSAAQSQQKADFTSLVYLNLAMTFSRTTPINKTSPFCLNLRRCHICSCIKFLSETLCVTVFPEITSGVAVRFARFRLCSSQ